MGALSGANVTNEAREWLIGVGWAYLAAFVLLCPLNLMGWAEMLLGFTPGIAFLMLGYRALDENRLYKNLCRAGRTISSIRIKIMAPGLLKFYVGVAILTLAFQIWIRSYQCTGIEGCGLSFAKAIVWSAVWPASWVVYLAGVLPASR
jgi:hypothetical protein